MTVSGWPNRAGRAAYGPALRDERRVADPRSELGAKVLELTFWQLGALGMLAPKVAMLFSPAEASGAGVLKFGVMAWDQVVYSARGAPFPNFAYASVSHVGGAGGSDMRFTFDSTVAGRDGAQTALAFSGGLARGAYLTAGAVPVSKTLAAVVLENAHTVRVAVRPGDESGAAALVPVVVVLW